jgi:hypothetical protein
MPNTLLGLILAGDAPAVVKPRRTSRVEESFKLSDPYGRHGRFRVSNFAQTLLSAGVYAIV